MHYVIGALQAKLPRAPLTFNPGLVVVQCELAVHLCSLVCLSADAGCDTYVRIVPLLDFIAQQ